ncbi:MAG: (S)-ureidoglycine aminohydrolase [Rhodobacteraceae bacterium]|nr:(S)-ureidoglycine aminohydrolase [Paracoccaceae bacterium]
MTGRAVFTEAYAVIPRGVMRDIVTSLLPGWEGARAWILARPLSGFAETFAMLLVELEPHAHAPAPEPEAGAQGVLYVTGGAPVLHLEDTRHSLSPGSYAYLPPGCAWSLENPGDTARLIWLRKRWEPAPGLTPPAPFVTSEADHSPVTMPGAPAWKTTRFVDPADLRHDMHVNIVTFEAGGSIPFEETHVMEHGLFILEGKGAYRLNRDWVEVEAGDFLWLRAFCPQACYAAGPGRFRYLLYKDVNRHPALARPL